MTSLSNRDAKQCHFCTHNVKYLDYRQTEVLKKFLDPYARILRRTRTGTCAKHQRQLSRAVKRSRYLALLPFLSR